MRDKNILQDKLNQAIVEPSDKLWHKVETGLQREDKIRTFKRRSILGWAAAVIILVATYITSQHGQTTTDYIPVPLELYDQAGEVDLQQDFYSGKIFKMNYRKDGRLVPNYQTIWKHPLVPVGKSL